MDISPIWKSSSDVTFREIWKVRIWDKQVGIQGVKVIWSIYVKGYQLKTNEIDNIEIQRLWTITRFNKRRC